MLELGSALVITEAVTSKKSDNNNDKKQPNPFDFNKLKLQMEITPFQFPSDITKNFNLYMIDICCTKLFLRLNFQDNIYTLIHKSKKV